jgi:hypothetical protein
MWRQQRSGGTESSNPACSSGESATNRAAAADLGAWTDIQAEAPFADVVAEKLDSFSVRVHHIHFPSGPRYRLLDNHRRVIVGYFEN